MTEEQLEAELHKLDPRQFFHLVARVDQWFVENTPPRVKVLGYHVHITAIPCSPVALRRLKELLPDPYYKLSYIQIYHQVTTNGITFEVPKCHESLLAELQDAGAECHVEEDLHEYADYHSMFAIIG